ncbi:MAG: COX15/CtaA family protein [Pseudomonadota bacterium]
MHAWTPILLALTALAITVLPLAVVWRAADPDKLRKLVWVCVFLTFDLIVFGAFTRLTDSGLGCPDWPGCYGLANPLLAHEQIASAQALMPTGPVTVMKAWIEMIHRFLAMTIGLLTVVLMAWAWARRRAMAPLATALFLFICLQGAFGAWTVTLKLQPVIVTTHLLLGMGLLALVTWLGVSHGRRVGERSDTDHVSAMATLALATLFMQIALGGWVSTNYATLACSTFPGCGELDFAHGFTLWRELGKTAAGHYIPFAALAAIMWVHRNFAAVVLVVVGYTAWRAWPHAPLRTLARQIAILLALQAITGIATIYLDFPLAIAVLHNAGAALLVLCVTMLNYRARQKENQ